MTTTTTEMPSYLRLIVPDVGTIWEWEPLKPYARCLLRVTAVKWNGEECWVESEPMIRNVYYNAAPDAKRSWNELARWVEATVLVTANEDYHTESSRL